MRLCVLTRFLTCVALTHALTTPRNLNLNSLATARSVAQLEDWIVVDSCDIYSFGAVGDNSTDDTLALQNALNTCAGKGKVTVPSDGVFLIKPVEIPSHSHLEIAGTLSAWRDIESWPNSTTKLCATTKYQTPREKTQTAPQLESLLWAANATNITITGLGVVEGQGWLWWPLRNDTTHGDYWHNCRPSLLEFGRRGPYYDSGVSHLRIEGITLRDSPFWTFSARDVDDMVVRAVKITTTGCGYAEAPNTDGFNTQGRNILFEDCVVRNGDDCVPIFPPTRNVTVRNTTCSCGNGLATIIWPAMSVTDEGGDIEDVVFDGARLLGTHTGAVIKSLPSFVGTVRNVTYKNIVMEDVGQAVMFNTYNQGTGITWETPTGVALARADSVTLQNITGTADVPGKINCGKVSDGGVTCTNIKFEDVVIESKKEGANYQCNNAEGTAVGSDPVPPCLNGGDNTDDLTPAFHMPNITREAPIGGLVYSLI